MLEKKTVVKRIFDSIAFRYDLLNHLLSFGLDFYWRKKALNRKTSSGVFYFADTTGFSEIVPDSLVDFLSPPSDSRALLFSKKSEWISGRTIQMVAENIPIKNESVSNIIVAFGVRNFYDIEKGFNSFYRILKHSGQVTILEFRMPENIFLKRIYKFYFKKILPFIGGLISGDKEAYKYLPSSVEEFDLKIDLPEMLKMAGFRKIISKSLTFGIVQVIISTK
ncbi:MAG: class I SAM-dependent methyltransferase [Ignavibacteriaceae bacterium]